MELTIRGLSKQYGEKRALDDFSCSFTPGITGILGPNGAGKSTLMHLITDCTKRQTGEILYNGTDILKLKGKFRKKLGFMPQSQGLYEQMTAYDFLCYMAQLKGLRRSGAQIRELLKVVNLEAAAHSPVGSFSGGMRQRVLLAQALLGQPEILLLDEPTAGLDPEERVRLRTHIAALSAHRIVLITTHVTGDLESIADRILLIAQGKLQLAMETSEFIYGCGASDLEEAYLRRLHAL